MRKKRNSRGSVVVYLGPMFSEKTGRALLAARKEAVRRRRDGGMQRVCFLKLVRDKRSKGISSRMGMEETACEKLPSDSDQAWAVLQQVLSNPDWTIIVMDEIQFFPLPEEGAAERVQEIVELLLSAATRGKKIFLAGLDADCLRRPYAIAQAFLLDPRIRKHFRTAFCDVCEAPATLSQRLLNGSLAPRDMPREIVEGKENGVTYEPRCFRCHVIPP